MPGPLRSMIVPAVAVAAGLVCLRRAADRARAAGSPGAGTRPGSRSDGRHRRRSPRRSCSRSGTPRRSRRFVALTQDPGSPTLSPVPVARASSSIAVRAEPGDIATITRYLEQFGITVDEVYADHLLIKSTGTADAFDQAFDRRRARLRASAASASTGRITRRGSRSCCATCWSRSSASSNEPQFHPMHRRAAQRARCRPPAAGRAAAGGAIATGVPGDYTVGDVANLYNINPLYDGAHRRHRPHGRHRRRSPTSCRPTPSPTGT